MDPFNTWHQLWDRGRQASLAPTLLQPIPAQHNPNSQQLTLEGHDQTLQDAEAFGDKLTPKPFSTYGLVYTTFTSSPHKQIIIKFLNYLLTLLSTPLIYFFSLKSVLTGKKSP